MPSPRRLRSAALVGALWLAAGCANAGRAVHVTYRSLVPGRQVAMGLVNATAQSAGAGAGPGDPAHDVRSVTDDEMEVLLADLRSVGFFRHATQRRGGAEGAAAPGSSGVVVVSQDGVEHGLSLRGDASGGEAADAFVEAKNRILLVHSQAAAPAGLESPDRVLDVPDRPRLVRP
jgi:hypothetical protein